jgi:hypothetical protein
VALRRILHHERVHLIKEGFEHSTHWAHTTTALFVFASDFLKPVLPLCTVRVAATALCVPILLLLAMQYRVVSMKAGYSLLMFCVITAILSLGMLGLETAIGDEHGALADMFPAIERLQEKLGVIDKKLDAVKHDTEALLQGQKQEATLTEARHADAMAAQKRLERLVIDAAASGTSSGGNPRSAAPWKSADRRHSGGAIARPRQEDS